MKKLAVTLILAGGLLSGCAGVVNSPSERWNNYQRITDLNAREFVDDWDSFWLYDKPSPLTPYRISPGVPY